MLVAVACNTESSFVQPVTSSTMTERTVAEGDVPPRDFDSKIRGFSTLSDVDLFSEGARIDSVFSVGLKSPGTQRGYWRGKQLASEQDVKTAREAIRQIPEVKVLWEDSILPLVRVKATSSRGISVLRKLPYLDYINPTLIPREGEYQDSGCDWPSLATPLRTSPDYPDAYPESYWRSQIDLAWRSTQGAGITIGLTDTGISPYDAELVGNFSTGLSSGRTLTQGSIAGTNSMCSHGHRMAGVIAAPMNGTGLAGVAWKANLYSVQASNTVLNYQGDDQMLAIRMVGNGGAKVITMAWSAAWTHDDIGDEISRLYYQNDVVFVAAAGTSPSGLPKNYVVFPANKLEVLAVSSADFNGGRNPESHYGAELDLVAFGAVGATGVFGSPLTELGASSSATAIVSGVAALVRSRYPTMRNYEVYAQMKNTAALCQLSTGFGPIVNALAAVGSFCGPGWIASPIVSFDSANSPAQTVTVSPYVSTTGNALSYWWNTNGSTASSYSMTVYPGPVNGQETQGPSYGVKVTDTFSGEARWYFGNVIVRTGGQPPQDCGGYACD